MSAEHLHEVDPLPSLQLPSSVVVPSQGSEALIGAHSTLAAQQQQAFTGLRQLDLQQDRQQQYAAHFALGAHSSTAASSSAAAAGVQAQARAVVGIATLQPYQQQGPGPQQRFYPVQQPQRFAPAHQHRPPQQFNRQYVPRPQQQFQYQQPYQHTRYRPAAQQQRPVLLPAQPPPHAQEQQPTQQQRSATPPRVSPQEGDPQHGSPSGSHNSGQTSSSNRLPDSPEGPDIVKVSHRSRISAVAGKIAHDVRDGRLPRIMVVGNLSIATATKAIAQARRYLRPEGQDIAFSPHFRTEDHSRALLELSTVLMPVERGTAADNLAQLDNAGGHETRIANNSRHARVGSAVARQLRNRGISVLCSVGAEALANSVMATAHAACFLADTGRQMVVQPIHVVLQRNGHELHSFKLVVMFAN